MSNWSQTIKWTLPEGRGSRQVYRGERSAGSLHPAPEIVAVKFCVFPPGPGSDRTTVALSKDANGTDAIQVEFDSDQICVIPCSWNNIYVRAAGAKNLGEVSGEIAILLK